MSTKTAEVDVEEEEAVKKDVEADLEAALEEGLDDLKMDLDLPEEYELEIDASERLGLMTQYSRLEIQVRTSKKTGQQDNRVNELSREKSFVLGQLERIDLKWEKRGMRGKLKSLYKEIANVQAKTARRNRMKLLESEN